MTLPSASRPSAGHRRARRERSSKTAPGTTIPSGAIRVQAHLAALDLVYTGVIEDIRKYIEETEELDPVTQDLLIDQAGNLEKFQWFVRAHLESAGGKLTHQGSTTEKDAARSARSS